MPTFSPEESYRLVANILRLLDRDTEAIRQQAIEDTRAAYDLSLKDNWPSFNAFLSEGHFVTTAWMLKHAAIFAVNQHRSELALSEEMRVIACVLHDATPDEIQQVRALWNRLRPAKGKAA